jgi:sulfite exporter TauE/SafE
MQNFWIAFLAGLTTGGLSCLAVQGGLLASTLAQQVEEDISLATSRHGKQRAVEKNNPADPGHAAQPILLFLLAKLAAYTLLGILLGALGSILQLTATMRAVLQFAIGIFMIGNALRMLNVHPIFRYFAFEPPSFVTRYIRRKSKNNVNLVTRSFWAH